MKKCLIIISAAVLICSLLTGCFGMIGDLRDSLPIGETPPAGTYGVSSIGTEDGSMTIYSNVTDELMIINEDGTGSFYFDETHYDIVFKGSTLFVDDERTVYTYMPSAGGESMLMLFWYRDGVNSIALRPVVAEGDGDIIR